LEDAWSGVIIRCALYSACRLTHGQLSYKANMFSTVYVPRCMVMCHEN